MVGVIRGVAVCAQRIGVEEAGGFDGFNLCVDFLNGEFDLILAESNPIGVAGVGDAAAAVLGAEVGDGGRVVAEVSCGALPGGHRVANAVEDDSVAVIVFHDIGADIGNVGARCGDGGINPFAFRVVCYGLNDGAAAIVKVCDPVGVRVQDMIGAGVCIFAVCDKEAVDVSKDFESFGVSAIDKFLDYVNCSR